MDGLTAKGKLLKGLNGVEKNGGLAGPLMGTWGEHSSASPSFRPRYRRILRLFRYKRRSIEVDFGLILQFVSI